MTKPFDWDAFNREAKELENSLEQTDIELQKLRDKSNYQDREAKKLVSEIANTIVDLDQEKKIITKQLNQVSDKDKRMKLLEGHYKVTSKIEDYWKNKQRQWDKGLSDIEKEGKK